MERNSSEVADRLLIMTSYWPEEDNANNGIFVIQQLHELAGIFREVLVVVVKPMRRRTLHVDLPHNVSVMHQPIPTLPQSFGLHLTMSINAMVALMVGWIISFRTRRFCNFFLLIHDVRFAFLCGGRLLPKADSSCLLLHGVDEALLNECRRSSIVSRRIARLRRSLRAVVVVGPSLNDYCFEVIGRSTRREFIPNGHVPAHENHLRLPRSDVDRRINIACVGNLVESKGVDILVRAVAILRKRNGGSSIRVTIVGDGPMRKVIQAEIEKNGLEDCIRMLGRVSHDVVLSVMADADIFCLPSHREAFGIVFVEAMSAGAVPIGVSGTGADIMIRHNETGFLCPPRDVDAIADAIYQLITDPELRLRLSQCAQHESLKFTWAINAAKVASLLFEVKSRRQGRIF